MIWNILIAILLFLATFPLKNWLEIRGIKAKDDKWSAWLDEKPNCAEYCQKNNQNFNDITCDYCGSDRRVSNLLMTISYRPKFGIISNTHNKVSHFKTYICSKCGNQLYRERYEL